jgi:hypothetical protein
MEKRILKAVVLQDMPGTPWATWMEQGLKTIETRWYSFKHRGDLVICCANSSDTPNAGLAVCVVDLYEALPMQKEHEREAKIEAQLGRVAHLTRDLRHFSRKFKFAPQKVAGSFQSTFDIEIPADVEIVHVPLNLPGL